MVLVQIKTPGLMLFYKESYWYKWRLKSLCGSTKNHTGTNNDSRVNLVLQRIILLQMEIPGYNVVLQRIILVQIETSRSMWFYKESYWYKWRLQCLGYSTQNRTGTNEGFSVLCGYTKNHTGTTKDSRVYVVLQRITLVQI
jgi:hypothetical protein